MRGRQSKTDFEIIQENIRKKMLINFIEFDILSIENLTSNIETSIKQIDLIIENIKGSTDENFFKYYQFLLSAFSHLFMWGNKELNALDGAEKNLKACKSNLKQIDFDYFIYIPDFQSNLKKLENLILNINEISEIKDAVDLFLEIPFPIIYTFEISNPNGISLYNNEDKRENEPLVYVLSIQFTIDNEPWANPQILRPEELYSIKGEIIINKWPEGYDTLVLSRVTSTADDWFELSLPPIERKIKNTYKIKGQIVFKYPQSSFDETISIRLLSYFKNASGRNIFPTIIGYDQLILKVLDPNSSPFSTGYNMMNKIVFDIAIAIEKELSNVDKTEKNDFLTLLSGILSYQGYCLQQGIYKEQKKVLEDNFRDNLIQHLIARSNLGEDLSKEAHLAGGRVEIEYKGIIAELKVEGKISDRDKLFEKYGKQPVAYASGNIKQLSILCILDLTEKKNPPASPQNNVMLLSPKVHGFENSIPEYDSKVVMIIIDGNTEKPSSYSK